MMETFLVSPGLNLVSFSLHGLRAIAIAWPMIFHAGATDVSWALPLGANHRASTGEALPAGMRFQIGVFMDGFIPTTENLMLWRAHWQAAGDVGYDVNWRGFAAVMRVEDNLVPFEMGAKLYFWGFFPTEGASSEWFLVTRTSWVVPSADPLAFPQFINLAEGDVIIGGADAASGAITTASVPMGGIPTFDFESWLRQYFFLVERKDLAVSGESADPDGDGLTNVMEYALGKDPRLPDSLGGGGGLQVDISEGTTVRVSFPGTLTVPNMVRIQTSENLVGWGDFVPELDFDVISARWFFTNQREIQRFWRLAQGP